MEWWLPEPESLKLQPQSISDLEGRQLFYKWMTATIAIVARMLLQDSFQ
jgi:hypothetical protein